MIEWKKLRPGQHRMPCPKCDKSPKDDALSVKVDDGGLSGVATCFRCGYIENWFDRQTTAGNLAVVTNDRQKKQPREPLADYGRRLIEESEALAATPAESYLRARECCIPPQDGDLRYHAHLWHAPTRSYWPAMIGIIRHVSSSEILGLHRTYLAKGGSGKAPVSPDRMVLGHKQGGAIMLWPSEAVSTGLGVAEGIETALSLAHAFQPVWSLIDAGNLSAFETVAGIEALTISVDHDPAGLNAAQECAARWTGAGRTVRLVIPPKSGQDLNDVAQRVA